MSQGLRARVRVSGQEQEVLEDVIKRRSSPHGLVTRANIILMSSQRQAYGAIAEALGIGTRAITRWTHRWESTQEAGVPVLARLVDQPRSGRPSEITPEQLCKLVALACESPGDHGLPITHWTREELATEAIKRGIVGTISGRHVGRLLGALDMKPHRAQYWLNAKMDPKRNEKIDAICEVYHSAEEAKKNEH
jgi:putative transposase